MPSVPAETGALSAVGRQRIKVVPHDGWGSGDDNDKMKSSYASYCDCEK
jgi:hypothetical protein